MCEREPGGLAAMMKNHPFQGTLTIATPGWSGREVSSVSRRREGQGAYAANSGSREIPRFVSGLGRQRQHTLYSPAVVADHRSPVEKALDAKPVCSGKVRWGPAR